MAFATAPRNKQLLWGQLSEGADDYAALAAKGHVASDCITCGQCESACPQQLHVIDYLASCAVAFGK